jgi:hypothetical protein
MVLISVLTFESYNVNNVNELNILLTSLRLWITEKSKLICGIQSRVSHPKNNDLFALSC